MNNDHANKRYIKNRYFTQQTAYNGPRLFNGFHFQKRQRISRPFSSFFPDPKNIRKKSADH